MAAVWDADVPDRAPERRAPNRRPLLIAGVVALVAIAGFVMLSGGASRPESDASQVDAPPTSLKGPGTRTWVELTPADGSARDGWPPPMLARGSEVCFGFGRLDFEPPTRPTIARCIDAFAVPDLGPSDMASLIVVIAGSDVWHVVQTGSEVESMRLVDAAGRELSAGRVHLAGDVVALRVPIDAELSELSWVSGRTRYVCTPAADAATSGAFCTDATG